MAFKMKGFPMQQASAFKQNGDSPEEKYLPTIDEKAKLKNKWNNLEDTASDYYNNVLTEDPDNPEKKAKHAELQAAADKAHDTWKAYKK